MMFSLNFMILVVLWRTRRHSHTLLKGSLHKGLYKLDLSKLCNRASARNLESTSSSVSSSAVSQSCYHVITSSNNAVSSSLPMPGVVNQKCTELGSPINKMDIWHQRLGHPNANVLTHVLKMMKVSAKESSLSFCDACSLGKLHQHPHFSQPLKTTKPF